MGQLRLKRSGIPGIQNKLLAEIFGLIYSNAWNGYTGVTQQGYYHDITCLSGQGKSAASELLPRIHRVAALVKRWLLGTHQGAVRPDHLDYFLDEYTSRFNRRRSRSRGKLFYRLLQQVVQVEPSPYKEMVGGKPLPAKSTA